MTDKEMIEKMAKMIHYDYWGTCGKGSCSDCPHNVHNICKDKIIAEKLYNKLFPEGSVVLSREEYEELQKGVKTHNYTAMFNAVQEARITELEERLCNIAYETRKETAREFAKGICKMLWNRGKDKNGKTFDYGDLTSIDVYELAKQFGVEIKE